MSLVRILLLWLAILAAFVGLGWLAMHAEAGPIEAGLMKAVIVPEGFLLQREDTGVKLFRKDYKNGSPDFVQVIDYTLGSVR